MSQPQVYRDVDIPDKWEHFSMDAKVNYLSTLMDRKQILELVGEAADIPEEEIGEQSIHKTGLAQIAVKLEE